MPVRKTAFDDPIKKAVGARLDRNWLPPSLLDDEQEETPPGDQFGGVRAEWGKPITTTIASLHESLAERHR